MPSVRRGIACWSMPKLPNRPCARGAEALTGPSDTLSGQIRIGAPDGSANYILPQVCAQIGEDHPDLDIQIVALPRVINLSRREADMAVTVSPPTAGQLLVQKLTDYKLHMVGSHHYLRKHPPIEKLDDLKGHKMIGYIPDMIFDRETGTISVTSGWSGWHWPPIRSLFRSRWRHRARRSAWRMISHCRPIGCCAKC